MTFVLKTIHYFWFKQQVVVIFALTNQQRKKVVLLKSRGEGIRHILISGPNPEAAELESRRGNPREENPLRV